MGAESQLYHHAFLSFVHLPKVSQHSEECPTKNTTYFTIPATTTGAEVHIHWTAKRLETAWKCAIKVAGISKDSRETISIFTGTRTSSEECATTTSSFRSIWVESRSDGEGIAYAKQSLPPLFKLPIARDSTTSCIHQAKCILSSPRPPPNSITDEPGRS